MKNILWVFQNIFFKFFDTYTDVFLSSVLNHEFIGVVLLVVLENTTIFWKRKPNIVYRT